MPSSTPPSTIADFYARIESARKRLGISEYGCWYRGHAFGDKYNLTPSLFRRDPLPSLNEERNIFADFVTESHRHLQGVNQSWEIISIMRHYGCPTRFLDWTDSLHVALFFAVLDEAKYEKPCIWILNPYDLNFKATHKRMIFDECDKIGVDYYEQISGSKWPYELPIAMAPKWVNHRMVAQRGFFTFHGTDSRSVNEISKGSVQRVSIPDDIINNIREELYRSRTDHRSIYPDLYGLGRYASLRFIGTYSKK